MKELKNFKQSQSNKLLAVLLVNSIDEKKISQALYGLCEQMVPADTLILTHNLSAADKKTLKKLADKPIVEVIGQDEEGNPTTNVIEAQQKLNYIIETTDKDTFAKAFNQSFNYAITNGYEWICILEAGDVLDIRWFQYFKIFEQETKDVDVFLPILKNMNSGTFAGFFNEAAWVEGLSEEAGFFDLQLLLRTNSANVTGGVFNIEAIKEYSEERDGQYYPIKENIRLSFSYEFFLRMIYNDIKMYTIPRLGYEYTVLSSVEDRYDEFLSKVPPNITQIETSKKGMTPEEFGFWLDKAKKEYFFDEQRDLVFKPKALEEAQPQPTS